MIPELIDPIKITIEQIDKINTPFTGGVAGRREPVGSVVRKTAFKIDAQIVFTDREQLANRTQLGTDEQAKGYFVLRFKDLNALGKVLKRGDKIIKMGQLDKEFYILNDGGDPAAHFSFNNEFTLIRMFFADRKPVGDRTP